MSKFVKTSFLNKTREELREKGIRISNYGWNKIIKIIDNKIEKDLTKALKKLTPEKEALE